MLPGLLLHHVMGRCPAALLANSGQKLDSPRQPVRNRRRGPPEGQLRLGYPRPKIAAKAALRPLRPRRCRHFRGTVG
jgi:hypothetical protein